MKGDSTALEKLSSVVAGSFPLRASAYSASLRLTDRIHHRRDAEEAQRGSDLVEGFSRKLVFCVACVQS